MLNIEFSQLEKDIWKALEEVKDPEIPAISVVDLGMITNVSVDDHKAVTVTMTPTFAACPAIEVLQQSIKKQIQDNIKQLGINKVDVQVNYDIQWDSNRITEKGKKILKKFGLAPPPSHAGDIEAGMLQNVECPFCDSTNTSLKSTFGSTLCRAIHFCNNCKQSFEQFKPVA